MEEVCLTLFLMIMQSWMMRGQTARIEKTSRTRGPCFEEHFGASKCILDGGFVGGQSVED